MNTKTLVLGIVIGMILAGVGAVAQVIVGGGRVILPGDTTQVSIPYGGLTQEQAQAAIEAADWAAVSQPQKERLFQAYDRCNLIYHDLDVLTQAADTMEAGCPVPTTTTLEESTPSIESTPIETNPETIP